MYFEQLKMSTRFSDMWETS